MFSITTNIFMFAVYVIILIVEFIFTEIFNLRVSTPWLLTTLVYILFIAYQILSRTNEYLEKGKVKEILYSIMDTINGIPLINRDNRIIIQWDVIFKKLIDRKAFFLYDNIVKLKPKTIDHYVNRYPSLLLNSSTDMVERNNKINTKSIIKGKNDTIEIKDSDINRELMDKLFIKYVSADKITIANLDSSIYIDFIINDEFEPAEYEKLGIKPDKRYDGFSVVAYYKDQKYYVVPRIMLFAKRIDKEKWLYQNINRLMQVAENIAAGIPEYGIIVDELSLQDVISDYIEEEKGKIPDFHFECIDEDLLVFSGLDKGKETAKAYCVLVTNHNGFEIKLVKYELVIDGVGELVEEERTIAIGSAYQPLIAIMEKMQTITKNIKLAIAKKDIEELVIKQ